MPHCAMMGTNLLGRKQRLLVGLAFGCVAFALVSAFTYRHHRPSVDQPSPDDQMYDVYSRAIRELFLEETKSPNDLRAKLVVIKDHTFQYPWQEWDDPTKRALAWAKNGIVVSKRTAEDFKRKCKNSISLEPRFTLPGKQVLIGDQQFEQFFGANGTSWRGFYESYPNSVGYIVLSRVGFNPERDQAFLYIGRGCGGLCGEGYYVLLGKDGGGAWSVKHKDMLWVSSPPRNGTEPVS